MSVPIGLAARLDELSTEHHLDELEGVARSYATLLVLLSEARAALTPEFCGTTGSLAGRIDDVLLRRAPEHSVDGLVFENYGAGFGWFRA